jgi:hypothetical protein
MMMMMMMMRDVGKRMIQLLVSMLRVEQRVEPGGLPHELISTLPWMLGNLRNSKQPTHQRERTRENERERERTREYERVGVSRGEIVVWGGVCERGEGGRRQRQRQRQRRRQEGEAERRLA